MPQTCEGVYRMCLRTVCQEMKGGCVSSPALDPYWPRVQWGPRALSLWPAGLCILNAGGLLGPRSHRCWRQEVRDPLWETGWGCCPGAPVQSSPGLRGKKTRTTRAEVQGGIERVSEPCRRGVNTPALARMSFLSFCLERRGWNKSTNKPACLPFDLSSLWFPKIKLLKMPWLIKCEWTQQVRAMAFILPKPAALRRQNMKQYRAIVRPSYSLENRRPSVGHCDQHRKQSSEEKLVRSQVSWSLVPWPLLGS